MQPSRCPSPRRLALACALLASGLPFAGALRAQSAAPAADTAPAPAPPIPTTSEVKEAVPVTLDPFVVSTKGDNGYLAASSLSGSRLNTNLADLAAPSTAFTQQFLEDVGLHSVDDLTEYMVNTRMNTPESNNLYFDADSQGFLIRGLPASTYSINFFPSTLKLDFFNLERVDQSRGPNSILFGLGNPGGLVNISTNRAVLNNTFGALDEDIGSYDEQRTAIDYNQVLVPGKVSLRLDAVRDDGDTFRTHEYDNQRRLYAALAWQISNDTRLDVEYEHGLVEKSLMQPETIIDGVTPWLNDGSHLSATANAAEGVAVISSTNLNAIDTSTGKLTDWKGTTASVSNTIAGTASWLSNFSLIPKNDSLTSGPQFSQNTNYTRGTVFLAHDFTPELNVELAANAQKFYHTAVAPRGDIMQIDTDPTLPDGTANPNAGRPFIDEDPVTTDEYDRAENVRLSASFTKDLGFFGKHTIATLFEKDWSRTESDQEIPINWTSPESTTLVNAANILFFRTYFNFNGPANSIGEGDWRPFLIAPPGANQTSKNFATTFITNPTTGYRMGVKWVEDSVPSDNHFTQDSGLVVLQSHFWNDRLVTVAGYRQDREDGWYSQTTAALAEVPSLPGFTTGEYAAVPSGPAIETNAYNLTYSALFKVTSAIALTYNHSRDSALPDPNALVVNPDGSSHVPQPHGKSEDMGIKVNLGQRMNLTVTYYQTSTTNAVANDNAAIEGEFPTIWAALNTAGISGPGGVNALNVPNKFNRYTFDDAAQGYEVELIANPTENIRLLANFSDGLVKETNLAAQTIAYVAKYAPYWQQYGTTPISAGITVASELAGIQQSIQSLYVSQEGQEARGQSQYQANLVPVYEFTSGWPKGFWIGGGVTYRSAPIVDYEAATAPGGSVQVYHGVANTLFNGMLGYKGKFKWMRNIGWSVQLNVNNVFNETQILPTRKINGLLDSYAVQAPREYLVSTRFSF